MKEQQQQHIVGFAGVCARHSNTPTIEAAKSRQKINLMQVNKSNLQLFSLGIFRLQYFYFNSSFYFIFLVFIGAHRKMHCFKFKLTTHCQFFLCLFHIYFNFFIFRFYLLNSRRQILEISHRPRVWRLEPQPPARNLCPQQRAK